MTGIEIEERLSKPLGQPIVFDGWCIKNAIQFVAELCGITGYSSEYIPPGGTEDAPYGAAGYDCPYLVLGRGTPLRPRYLFPAEMTGYNALQCLYALEVGTLV